MIEYFLPVSRSRIISAIRCLKSATDSCGGRVRQSFFVFVSMPDNTPIKADCQVGRIRFLKKLGGPKSFSPGGFNLGVK
jgi:hypothetical protein